MRAQQTDVYDKHGVLRRRQSATVHYFPRQHIDDLASLEFSDHGRDPRFLPGWWIVPGALLGSPFMFEFARLFV